MTVFLNSYGLVMRKPIVIFFACLAAAGAALGFTQVTWGSGGSDDSGFVGLTPARLLDTRQGSATVDGNDVGAGRVQPGDTYALDVTGRVGIPVDASVVNVNIVAVRPSGPGFLTVWPCSESRPLASAVNFTTGITIATGVTGTLTLASGGDPGGALAAADNVLWEFHAESGLVSRQRGWRR